jgi:hypothetical protein
MSAPLPMQVVILEGAYRGRGFALEVGQTLNVGRRTDSDLCLPDSSVGLSHCTLTRQAGGVWVEDLKSRNGTFINQARVAARQRHPVRPGDVLGVGRIPLQLTALADVDVGWLGWNEGAVLRLAQGIATAGRFADMPLLAEALRAAGCAEGELLAYCREPGTEACARWVLGLLLA